MTAPKDRKNPYGLRRDQDHAEIFKLHEGVLRAITSAAYTESEPATAEAGIECKEWSGVHVAFDVPDGVTNTFPAFARVRPWRYYSTMLGNELLGVAQGRWIPGSIAYIPINLLALALAGYSRDHVWATRDCEKMFFQVVDLYNEEDEDIYPDWFVWQAYGYTEVDAPHDVVVSSPSSGSGGSGGGGTAATEATHDLVVKAKGPQIMTEAKAFDGGVLPNVVAEGDAARLAATLYGIPYSMLVNKDGSDSPIVLHDDAISAANGGTATLMQGMEAKDFDGAIFPSDVAEGDAVRPAASLMGVPYSMLVNEVGDKTPMVSQDDAITAGVGTIGLVTMLEARTALPTAVAQGDAARPIADLYGRQMGAAFELASQSDRTGEIRPLNNKYITGTEFHDTTIADNVSHYWPSEAGALMDSWKDWDAQLYVIGGLEGENSAKIDVYMEVSSGMEIGDTRYWDDASLSGYVVGSMTTPADEEQTIRELGETSLISSTGTTAASRVIDFDNLNIKYWRLRYIVTLFDPDDDNAEFHVTPRRKAL